MPWSNRQPREARTGLALVCLAALLAFSTFLLSASPPEEKHISIYSTVANYTLPVVERNGQDYVGLLETLEPLGNVSARMENSRWKIRYNDGEGEFTPGQLKGRVRGQDVSLSAAFLLENNRGLIPLSSLVTLLPRFLGGPVTFRESSRRLFVGSVGVHFTAQVNRATSPRLVLDFTSPVNPMVATEPGKLRLVFTHEPLVGPGTPTLTFGLPEIPSATFAESNGAAEITVNGTVPLFASFSNDGRTITITPAPQAAGPAPAPNTPNAPTASTPSAVTSNVSSSVVRQYFVVVDAAHGGDDRGALLSNPPNSLSEKDVTLSFARLLRQQLESRGLSTLVLRDGDNTLGLDQRASLTNQTHPALYISVHAVSQGNGVRLYSALLPIGGENHGPFVDWQTAQSAYSSASQTIAISLAAELRKSQIPARNLIAPLRPLNNITVPAIAIEIGPPATGATDLGSTAYQQPIASSLANALAAARAKGDLRP